MKSPRESICWPWHIDKVTASRSVLLSSDFINILSTFMIIVMIINFILLFVSMIGSRHHVFKFKVIASRRELRYGAVLMPVQRVVLHVFIEFIRFIDRCKLFFASLFFLSYLWSNRTLHLIYVYCFLSWEVQDENRFCSCWQFLEIVFQLIEGLNKCQIWKKDNYCLLRLSDIRYSVLHVRVSLIYR